MFQTLVGEVPPGTERPPPVQSRTSWPPSSTRDWVQVSGAQNSRITPNNFFTKLSNLANTPVRLVTIQQTSGHDKCSCHPLNWQPRPVFLWGTNCVRVQKQLRKHA